jgi:hypothetical protein
MALVGSRTSVEERAFIRQLRRRSGEAPKPRGTLVMSAISHKESPFGHGHVKQNFPAEFGSIEVRAELKIS